MHDNHLTLKEKWTPRRTLAACPNKCQGIPHTVVQKHNGRNNRLLSAAQDGKSVERQLVPLCPLSRLQDSSLSLKKGSIREVEGKLTYCPGCLSCLISSCLPNISSLLLHFFNDNELSFQLSPQEGSTTKRKDFTLCPEALDNH